MATTYPGTVDVLPDAPAGNVPLGASAPTHTEVHQKMADVLNAVQATLGTDPQGTHATVKARIERAEEDAIVMALIFG